MTGTLALDECSAVKCHYIELTPRASNSSYALLLDDPARPASAVGPAGLFIRDWSLIWANVTRPILRNFSAHVKEAAEWQPCGHGTLI